MVMELMLMMKHSLPLLVLVALTCEMDAEQFNFLRGSQTILQQAGTNRKVCDEVIVSKILGLIILFPLNSLGVITYMETNKHVEKG